MTSHPDERDPVLHSLISGIKAPSPTAEYFEALFARVETTPQIDPNEVVGEAAAGVKDPSPTTMDSAREPATLRTQAAGVSAIKTSPSGLPEDDRVVIGSLGERDLAELLEESYLRQGLTIRQGRQRLPEELLEELYVRRRLSAEAVAGRVGCSKENVLADLRYWNLPRRRAGRGPEPLAEEFAERVLSDLHRDVHKTDPPGSDSRAGSPVDEASD